MHLSKKAIEAYREAYEKDFGENISSEEARLQFTELICFFQKLYRDQQTRKKPEELENRLSK